MTGNEPSVLLFVVVFITHDIKRAVYAQWWGNEESFAEEVMLELGLDKGFKI